VDARSPAGMQLLLFAAFAALTGAIGAVIAATYNNLLVPELSAGSLYPTLTATGGGSFLALAASMSAYLLTGLVDPAIGVVGLAVGLAYLGRSFLGRFGGAVEPLLGRLVLAVIVANFSLPIAGALLGLAGATYPVIAGFDGGAWRSWSALDGWSWRSSSRSPCSRSCSCSPPPSPCGTRCSRSSWSCCRCSRCSGRSRRWPRSHDGPG
jgi:hypothetical protein